jgi:hypothetical protein
MHNLKLIILTEFRNYSWNIMFLLAVVILPGDAFTLNKVKIGTV